MLDTFASIVQECSHVQVPSLSEQAVRYYQSGNILWMVNVLWSLVLPALFLWTQVSARLEKVAQKWGRVPFFTIAIYLLLFILIYSILSFPLNIYGGLLREHAYGLSTQTLSRWLENSAKELSLLIVGAIAFVWLFYFLLKKSPRRWWLYSAILSSAISFFIIFIQPIWIDPLFNQFGPMKDRVLEEQILSLAKRAGIENSCIFEVDKSADTNSVNAYVIGFGSTSRIVLWDTALKKLKTQEILFVVGHEMGHFVLHHIWWQILYYTLLSFVIFYLTYKGAKFVVKYWGKRIRVTHLHQIGSFPLLLFLLNLSLFLFSPLTNYFSRTLEHNADCFGLEITQNNKAAAEAFVVLQSSNLANPYPGPVYEFWRATHPSLGDRVAFCNSYCPWRDDLSLKYGKYFK